MLLTLHPPECDRPHLSVLVLLCEKLGIAITQQWACHTVHIANETLVTFVGSGVVHKEVWNT